MSDRADSKPDWDELSYGQVVEAIPTAILVVDAAGRIALVNAQAEQLFGHSRSELIGKAVEMLVPERDREAHVRLRAAYLADPSARPMGAGRDLYALRKDGREVPVEIGLKPLTARSGTYVLSSIIDISERRRAAFRFQTAVEAAPNAMVMTDAQGTIVLVNTQAESLFGYGRDELVGGSIDRLVPERFRRSHPEARAFFMSEPRVRSMGAGRDLFALRKDGLEVPVEIGLNPIETEEGTFVLSAIIEISQRKRAEETQARYARELERSNADLQEFAVVASHDLQEPLRKIAAFGELLQDRSGAALDQESRDYLVRMQGAAQRMSGLITSLLELSRVTTRGQPFRSVDLGEVVTEVLGDLEMRITETGATVTVRPLPEVMADRLQMRQVFQNLIGNALKFRSKERPAHVTVSAARADGGWEIRVADNGIGFDERYLDRLFKPFSRLNATSAYEGSGMGLAICRKIVVRHNGSIAARGTPGTGSQFVVTLPDGSSPEGEKP